MPKGGVRKGAGRKSIADELGTRDLARTAIIAKWGSLEKGLEWLLGSGESALQKFVFEHAFGKPQENVKVDEVSEITIKYGDGNIRDLINPASS
jgi:hypothetical protein